MSQKSLEFRVNFKDVQAAIGDIRTRVENPRALMQEIGDVIAEDIKNMITKRKMGPDDKPWAPWAPSTAKARKRKGNAGQGLLWDTGRLLRSIKAQVIGSHNTVQIGTDVKYAGWLNNGTEKMPARPFLGVSARAKKGINQVIESYFKKDTK